MSLFKKDNERNDTEESEVASDKDNNKVMKLS